MKLTTTIFWQVLLVLCIASCGVWIAAQWTADQLAYNARLGEPWFVFADTPIYQPWRFFGWWYSFEAYAPEVFDRAGLIAGSGGVIGLAGAVIGAVLRSREAKHVTTYGSSRWARRSEMKKAGLLTTEGVFLGRLSNTYLRHDGPEHVMAFAPTRSGKGVGLVVPTLLSWRHSTIIHDIKGENWDLTSGWRSKFSTVLRFDPTHPKTLRYNPLLEVRKGQHEVRDVQNIADILVDPDGGLERRNHWDKTAHALLVGAILHVLYAEEDKTLAGVAYLLSDPSRSFYRTLECMLATNHLGSNEVPLVHPVVAQSARELLNKSENERSGVLSTALSFLSLYRDPTVARATSACDFRIEDLVAGSSPLSLYLVVPPSDISRTRPLVRLILNQIGRRLTETHCAEPVDRHQVLFMLDEFPALGRLEFFETALGYMAGYGLRAFLIAQSLNQISKAYGPDNSILDNCHVRVSFASNDERTAKRISDALGSTTELRAMKNYAGHRLAPWLSHVMVSRQETARQLLTPGEVMQLPADDEIIMVAGAPPVRAKKLRYFEDKNFVPRVLPQIDPAQSDENSASSLLASDWENHLASAHASLGSGPDDQGGLQHFPSIEQAPITAPETQDEVGALGRAAEQVQRDLFGAEIVEANAFDELTNAELLQGGGT